MVKVKGGLDRYVEQTIVSKRFVMGKGGEIRAPSIHSVTTGNRKLRRTATTSPKAEKRIPLAWNETHEISFWQEPECD